MHRIDSPNALPGGIFTEGDPVAPIPATEVSADWLNAVQEEVANVITGCGVALDKAQNNQLAQVLDNFYRKVVATGTITPRTLADRFADVLDIRDFGAVPDFDPVTRTGTDNHAILQAAIYHCAANGIRLRIAGGQYGVWHNGSKRKFTDPASLYNGQYCGGLDIPSGTVMEWSDDSWLIQMQPSYGGAFLSNINRPVAMDTMDDVDWTTANVLLVNPRIDGSYMPLFGLTLTQDLTEPINDNCIGFAGRYRITDGVVFEGAYDRASNIRIIGGHLKGYRDIDGNGGKGIATERGCDHLHVSGVRIEDCCYATSVIYETDTTQTARNIVFEDMDVRRCGVVLLCAGQDEEGAGPALDAAQASIVWSGRAWCCGHHPDFSDLKSTKYRRHWKHGAIVLHAASSLYAEVVVNNPEGFPSATWPCGGTRYPATYPAFDAAAGAGTEAYYVTHCRGAGLSGAIGSLVSGWGYGVTIRAVLHGDCDDLWHINSGVPYGNSRVPTNAKMHLDLSCSGSTRNIFRNDLAGTAGVIATISEDRKTITFDTNSNLPDRDNELLGDYLLIGEVYCRCIGYTAASRTAILDSALDAGINISTRAYIVSAFAATGSALSGSLVARCDSVSQYLFPFWCTYLDNLSVDIQTIYDGHPYRLVSSVAEYANGKGSYVTYNPTQHSLVLGGTSTHILDVESVLSSRVGVLDVGVPVKIDGNCVPAADGTRYLGLGDNRWAQLFAATATINTSDAREKEQVAAVPEAVLRAWGKVELRQFLFVDAVAAKGAEARLHTGVIAQQVLEAFTSEGLDATRYGLLCYDEWAEQPEISRLEPVIVSPAVQDAEGVITMPAVWEERKVVEQEYRPAGSRYGIRYEEALILEAAYQRWRALPLAGGTMTGELRLKRWLDTVVNLGNVSGALSIDLSAGHMFTMTVVGNITSIAITNPVPSGYSSGVFLRVTNGGAYTIDWSTFDKAGGTAPTLTASGVDLLTIAFCYGYDPIVCVSQKGVK